MKRQPRKKYGSTSGRPSIVKLVFAQIRKKRLYLKDGKTGAPEVIQAVRASFPHNRKFGLLDYAWCLSRFRRQRKAGLPTNRIVPIPASEPPK
jgi:hypothetical protein